MRNVYRQRTTRNTRQFLDVVVGAVILTATIVSIRERNYDLMQAQFRAPAAARVEERQVDLNGDGTLETIICIDKVPYIPNIDVYARKSLQAYAGKKKDQLCN